VANPPDIMPTILFADRDALRLALASGAVPAAVARAPARAGADAQGRLWVEPAAPLPRRAAAALARLGAPVPGTSGADPTPDVACWARLLPLAAAPPAAPDRLPSPVLFDLPDAAALPALVGELRRLGAGRSEFRLQELGDEDQKEPPAPPPRALLL